MNATLKSFILITTALTILGWSQSPQEPSVADAVNTPSPEVTVSPSPISEPSTAPALLEPTATPESVTSNSAPMATPQKTKTPSKTKSTEKEPMDYGIIKSDERGLVHLDFVNVELSDLIKGISELTKKNFVYDESVKGKITLVSPKPVTPNEAYRAFQSALGVKNFAVLRVGQLYKIVPTREMKQQPIKTDVPDSGAPDEIITRLEPIKHINAAEIVKSLKSMVSSSGDMIAYAPTNTLIITDSVGNINRMLKIIGKLDQAGFQETIEVIALKYSPAADTADKIMKIFDLASAPTSQPKPSPGAASEERAQYISKIIPDERTNSLIVMANDKGMKKLKDIIRKIDQAVIDAAGKGRIHVHALQYADAIELAATLSGSTAARPGAQSRPRRGGNTVFPTAGGSASPSPPPPSQGASSGGQSLLGDQVRINADPYTNSLIITASPADYESLLPVIHRLDVRRPQAFVEAMILEVDIDKASELGVSGNAAKSIGRGNMFGATTLGSASSIFLPSSPAAIQGLVAGIQGPTVDIPLAGGQTLAVPIYGGFFRTLQSNGTINILSTPSILTQDNTEAEIVVGRVIPFITAQGRDINNQPINQVERSDVALTLRLTPQINVSDELTLNIFQESQDVVASANADTLGPTTSRRSAQTTVLVKNGQTVTVGGLINDSEEISESKVPVLGDIPILGWLFKNKSKRKRKTSLVIFVTPHIIRYPEDLERISLRKEEERQLFLKSNRVQEQEASRRKNIKEKIRIKSDDSGKQAPPAHSPTGQFQTIPTPVATQAPELESTPEDLPPITNEELSPPDAPKENP